MFFWSPVETNKLETPRYSSTRCPPTAPTSRGFTSAWKSWEIGKAIKGFFWLFCFLIRDFDKQFVLMICSSVLLGHSDFGRPRYPHVCRNKSIDSSPTVAVCRSESRVNLWQKFPRWLAQLWSNQATQFPKTLTGAAWRTKLYFSPIYYCNNRVGTQANLYSTCHFLNSVLHFLYSS